MLTRHGKSHSKSALVLSETHPPVVNARPMFLKSANEHKRGTARILVSGMNSRKIGRVVTKGRWKGFPIYTLTLEERATCPTDCAMWRSCYGNRMPWSLRYAAGPETERRIVQEVSDLSDRHPGGFVVRLHVLGDFYSVAYVGLWRDLLAQHPPLHVFGFTARHEAIGEAVKKLALEQWDRFAIRSSAGVMAGMPAAHVDTAKDGVRCQVQTDQTATCGTCALCWSMPDKAILFAEH